MRFSWLLVQLSAQEQPLPLMVVQLLSRLGASQQGMQMWMQPWKQRQQALQQPPALSVRLGQLLVLVQLVPALVARVLVRLASSEATGKQRHLRSQPGPGEQVVE